MLSAEMLERDLAAKIELGLDVAVDSVGAMQRGNHKIGNHP